MSRPLGILGGVFDPPHHGHLAMAALARDFFGLDEVLFIPSGSPPHKASVMTPARDRLAMLEASLVGEPRFRVYDRELHRPGLSYTVDTIRELSRRHPGRPLYFLVGSDNLCEIATWHRYREILRLVTLCVAHRPGYSLRRPSALRQAKTLTFPSPEWGMSSTLIRSYLAAGLSCDHLIVSGAARYIAKKKLYKPAPGSSE